MVAYFNLFSIRNSCKMSSFYTNKLDKPTHLFGSLNNKYYICTVSEPNEYVGVGHHKENEKFIYTSTPAAHN